MTAVLFGPQALWFLTRASGLVLLVLLTVTVVLGVLGPVKLRMRHWPSFLTTAVHRDISLLTVVLLGIHVATTVLDGYAPVGWRDAVVPFVSPYRPVWLGLGALALDLVAALVVTSLLRGRIGYRTWRALHWTAYASWPVAMLHAFGTGSDVRRPAVQLLAAACGFALVGSVTWRAIGGSVRSQQARTATALTALVAPTLFAAWAVTGPLAPGWSLKAGDPTVPKPAAKATQQQVAVVRPVAATSRFRIPMHARVSGTVTRSPLHGGLTRLDLMGTLSAGYSGGLRVIADGRARLGDGLTPRAGGVLLGPLGDPTRLHGGIVTLADDVFALRLFDRHGHRYDATLRIAVSSDGMRFAGVLDVRPHVAAAGAVAWAQTTPRAGGRRPAPAPAARASRSPAATSAPAPVPAQTSPQTTTPAPTPTQTFEPGDD